MWIIVIKKCGKRLYMVLMCNENQNVIDTFVYYFHTDSSQEDMWILELQEIWERHLKWC